MNTLIEYWVASIESLRSTVLKISRERDREPNVAETLDTGWGGPFLRPEFLSRFGFQERCSCFGFSASAVGVISPPGDATAYQLLHRSINRQVANVVSENDANLALSPTFRYVSIESLLLANITVLT
ncbi:hypothetical protein TNCV_2004491 [Trichonephila clavipes]|nr:hypothetical protein TNCV_2004491 [Trichonephila clavipes]